MEDRVRGRFAPTPSGRMHLGNVFCALLSWLSAKSAGGEMVLRIEDIDTDRCKEAYIGRLLDDLHFLGLTFDEGADGGLRQSKRTALYEQALQVLQQQGLVYPCFCSRDELHAVNAPHASDGRTLYPGTCRTLTAAQIAQKAQQRSAADRLRVPNQTVCFQDRHYGTQRQALANDWGDFVLRRSDGLFAYQLAVTVDDAAMGITEVVRGRDLLPSVAPQCYLYHLLGGQPPAFAHVPLLLSADGRRLSKRDADFDMDALRQGYPTPEPLIGKLLYLAGQIDRPEPLSAQEAIPLFSWQKLPTDDIRLSQDCLTIGEHG